MSRDGLVPKMLELRAMILSPSGDDQSSGENVIRDVETLPAPGPDQPIDVSGRTSAKCRSRAPPGPWRSHTAPADVLRARCACPRPGRDRRWSACPTSAGPDP